MGEFPDRVTLGEDGSYRWRYDLKAHHNTAPMEMMVKISLAVGVPIALIMLVLTWQYGPLQATLSSLGMLAMLVLLPTLIWKLLPPDPMFRMDEAQIEAWPKGRSSGIYAFKGLTEVTPDPGVDRIILRWRVTRLEVYVPPEDYEFVKAFLMERAGINNT